MVHSDIHTHYMYIRNYVHTLIYRIWDTHTSLDLSKCLYKHSCKGVGLQNITLSTTKIFARIQYTYMHSNTYTFIW